MQENNILLDPKALFKLSYGLFILTAAKDSKDNGCIINTATQITNSPERISVAVNKSNYTHDMIERTGMFNLSVLSEQAKFDIFEHFGFRSGRDIDKFSDYTDMTRSENGIYYINNSTNAFISGKVVNALNYDTHTLFIAEVTECRILSDIPSATYQYYFDNIKPKTQPKPQTESNSKKTWVCKICGYVYEGDELPADFICPLCKHGAEDFELVE